VYVPDRLLIDEAIDVTEVPDFNAGGFRFKDLVDARIVSSRSDLNYKQTKLGFPRPIKTGKSAAWFPKSEVFAWLAQRAALRDRPTDPEQPMQKVSRPTRP
jgi:predicted DNA-binding transcriptional regulator AlpA